MISRVELRKSEWLWISIMIGLLILTVSCAQRESLSVDLGGMFPYFDKEFETRTIDFGAQDASDEKYLLKGWSVPKREQGKGTYRWAVGDESIVGAYFTELKGRSVLVQCLPSGGKHQSYQAGVESQDEQGGHLYINGIFLKTLSFLDQGEVRIEIPSEMIHYGSNLISFRWKHKHARIHSAQDLEGPAVRFFRMDFQETQSELEQMTQEDIDFYLREETLPTAVLPSGALLEYYFDLPPKPVLKFGLSFHGEEGKDAHVNLAVYGHSGRHLLRVFTKKHSSKGKTLSVKLDRFAGETVKVVFANSSENRQGFRVSWINPVVFSNKVIPLRQGIPAPVEERKKQSNPKQGISPKNIFIYLVDTLRADHMSCYGYERETTPFVDTFAEEGILFRNYLANASWTKPTVGSLLTGFYPNKHRAEDRKEKMSDEALFLSEILKPFGYTTISITTNPSITREFNFMQGVDIYFSNPTRHHSSEYVNSVFASLLETNPELKQKPMFAYLHTMDPHFPYTPLKPFRKFKKVDKERDRLRLKSIIMKIYSSGLNQDDVDYLASLYDCEILQSDHYFNVFLDSLKKHGLYDDSIIIFTADHGEQLYEHGGWNHGHSIYNEEIHIPLIIKLPKNEDAGLKPDAFVTQVDVLPTILEYIGIEPPSSIDGISIFNRMKNPTLREEIFIKEKIDKYFFTGLVTIPARRKYIYQYSDILSTDCIDSQMYDLKTDAQERNNLFTWETLFEMKSVKYKVDCFLKEMRKSSLKAEDVDFEKIDPEIVRALRALGYIK
jgi:hypothetical protein